MNFGLNRGAEISDPKGLLEGSGNLYRHIKVTGQKDFPESYIKQLLKEAYKNARSRSKEDTLSFKGSTIVKSVSEKKKRPKN